MDLYRVCIGHRDDCIIVLEAGGVEDAALRARSLPSARPIRPDDEVTAALEPRDGWIVGDLFRGPGFLGLGSSVYECMAYDWRTGWWMRNQESGEVRDISERAIGRTYHRHRASAQTTEP